MDIGVGRSGRGVLEGAFRLLDVLSRSASGAGLSEVARAAELPKATAYRLLEQLIVLGAVQHHERRYFVGRTLARLGSAWQPDPGLQRTAREPVRVLAALTSAAVAVTVLKNNQVRAVAGTRGAVTEIPRIHPEDTFSTTTAAGRILVAGNACDAGSSVERRRAHIEARVGGPVLIDRHEVVNGVCCVAAPIWQSDGTFFACVSAMVAGLTDLVLRASREITHQLTHT